MAVAGLPGAFQARMRELLGDEADAFLDSLGRPAERAVRANPGKLDPAGLPGLLGIGPDPVPWCREGWFLPEGVRVGDTVAHAAGLFYVQEPSAMAVGEALDVRPGQRVLDLAAAPCSGEGLFRRNPAAAAQWRPGHVRGSAERQRGLLADAARLVGPGGVLVYSTCTFAPEENEQQVAGFLTTHPDWEVGDIPWHEGFAPGRPDWAPGGPPGLARTVRLWPHRLRGEGHFIAKLVQARGNPPHQLVGP